MADKPMWHRGFLHILAIFHVEPRSIEEWSIKGSCHRSELCVCWTGSAPRRQMKQEGSRSPGLAMDPVLSNLKRVAALPALGWKARPGQALSCTLLSSCKRMAAFPLEAGL